MKAFLEQYTEFLAGAGNDRSRAFWFWFSQSATIWEFPENLADLERVPGLARIVLKDCYGNSGRVCLFTGGEFNYWQGVCCQMLQPKDEEKPEFPFPFDHGWNIGPEGQFLDYTARLLTGRGSMSYIGINVPLEALERYYIDNEGGNWVEKYGTPLHFFYDKYILKNE